MLAQLVHQQGAGYEVELTTLSGDTVASVTLDASDVRPVEARETVRACSELTAGADHAVRGTAARQIPCHRRA